MRIVLLEEGHIEGLAAVVVAVGEHSIRAVVAERTAARVEEADKDTDKGCGRKRETEFETSFFLRDVALAVS